MDEGVKKVVDALQANGELDNTLIIYTSDNGYFHGEHRIPERQDAHLRGVDPGAARDARARASRRG